MKEHIMTEDIHTSVDTPVAREGRFTKSVEDYTAQVPSIAYLGLAVGSMLLSASLAGFTKRKTLANFVGLWVPTIMLVGIYNKLVKLDGHDQRSSQQLH
jgi:hypothetical protein